jgi:hypothetical protein
LDQARHSVELAAETVKLAEESNRITRVAGTANTAATVNDLESDAALLDSRANYLGAMAEQILAQMEASRLTGRLLE